MTERLYAFDPTRDQRHKQAVAYPECAAWQTAIELDGLAARTRLDYLRSVAKLLVAHPGKPARDFTHFDLNDYLATYPAGSRAKVRKHLNSWFNWLDAEELVDRNPMRRVRRPRPTGQTTYDIFTGSEVAAMCADHRLALMLHTGIRKGECRRLRRRHINLDHRELRVVDGKGGKDRVVPLNQTALKAVADIDLLERPDLDDYIWWTRPGGGTVIQRGRPIGEASFARWWKQSLRRVDVDYRNPHMTRHTFATMYLRAGGRMGTLSDILGHAHESTTSDIYAHLDVSDARADILLLDGAATA